MYILVYYVPEEALEKTKEALFRAGAGSIGNYSKCSWQVKGEGQFLPGIMSNPYTGKRGEIKKTAEFRVEMALEDSIRDLAVRTLLDVHPYETPAFHLIEVFKHE